MAPTKTSRSRLRSSATEPYSLDQCNEIINSHFKRTKHQSAPGGGEGRSTPAGDPTDPRRNASDSKRPTLKIIVKCKVEIENMVDVNQGDLTNDNEVDNASVYSTQTHGSGDGSRARYNNYRGYQGNHSNRSRGGYQSYKNNGKPINLDDRGNYLWDFYGNPIDASKEFDTAFALHSSTLENPKTDRGRGAPRGSRGSNRGRGLGQDRGANRGAQRVNDHGQRSYRGFGRGQGSNSGLGRG